MKKILFPTDFSQTANNAFVYALQFAASMGAEIITLHVYELPQVDLITFRRRCTCSTFMK
jgi:nucleotide-binding universal stress UspA family protein